MIIHLYGPDSYRRLQKQKEIIDEYEKKHSNLSVERFYFDGANDELLKFKDFISTRSLFGGNRLAVISGIGNSKKQEMFVDILKDIIKDKTAFVILLEDKKLGKDFSFLEKKPVLKQEFDFLAGDQFRGFIIREAKKRKVALTEEQLKYLTSVYPKDSWGAVTELEKIALSRHPGAEPKDFKRFFASAQNDKGGSIFNLIYKLKSNDLGGRLRTLEVSLINEDPAKVFNLTAYSVGNKNKFADYDAAIKVGKIDYETALLDWLLI